MAIVTISREFRVVIPRELRKSLRLVAGQRMMALAYDGRMQLLPLRKARELRGLMKGVAARFDRDDDRV